MLWPIKDYDMVSQPEAFFFNTQAEYCDWAKEFGTTTMPGCSWTLESASVDLGRKTATFAAIWTATHSGPGGPVDPTGKTTVTDYVYVYKFNDAGKIVHMKKIWHAGWAQNQLGWTAGAEKSESADAEKSESAGGG